ncbi:MAG: hypothetical protein KC419_04925 [Anaerolineales bacterium]|nr:hypothetical protein [Anaerolineales bacterium]
MKKRVWIFWSLVLYLGLVTACGAAETAVFTDFQAEVGGVNLSLSYPDTWVIEATPDTVMIASDASLLNAGTITSGAVIFISTLPTSALLTPDLMPLVEAELNNLQQQEGLQTREEASTITINGQEAITAVLDSHTGDTVFYFTLINGDSNIALILAQTGSADADTLQPLVEQTINTIQLGNILQ